MPKPLYLVAFESDPNFLRIVTPDQAVKMISGWHTIAAKKEATRFRGNEGGWLFVFEEEQEGLCYLARLAFVFYLWCWASQALRQPTLAQATLAFNPFIVNAR